MMLRRDLDRRGVPAVWHNIWEDDDARRFVRRANQGNETVPTVRVGMATLTNPSGREVAALLGLGPSTSVTASSGRRWVTRAASWLPVAVLVIGSEVITRGGHPGVGFLLDALAVAAWWFTRPLRR